MHFFNTLFPYAANSCSFVLGANMLNACERYCMENRAGTDNDIDNYYIALHSTVSCAGDRWRDFIRTSDRDRALFSRLFSFTMAKQKINRLTDCAFYCCPFYKKAISDVNAFKLSVLAADEGNIMLKKKVRPPRVCTVAKNAVRDATSAHAMRFTPAASRIKKIKKSLLFCVGRNNARTAQTLISYVTVIYFQHLFFSNFSMKLPRFLVHKSKR